MDNYLDICFEWERAAVCELLRDSYFARFARQIKVLLEMSFLTSRLRFCFDWEQTSADARITSFGH